MRKPPIADEEYARLSDQKADDWRSISEVTPTLFGVAGAIFAAGVAARNGVVFAFAPIPVYLGLFHMVRNAKLQLQMITYLAVRGTADKTHWETTRWPFVAPSIEQSSLKARPRF